MTTDTSKCTQELHQNYGGACFWCCEACNHARHLCHFCGEELRHDSTDWDSKTKHGCYAVCECGHISHEHFDDSCRGGEFELLSTDCSCTEFRPKEKAA